MTEKYSENLEKNGWYFEDFVNMVTMNCASRRILLLNSFNLVGYLPSSSQVKHAEAHAVRVFYLLRNFAVTPGNKK